MTDTFTAFDKIVSDSKAIFLSKIKDYGISWEMLRPQSLTDIVNIKARRIRSIEEKQKQLIEESIENEYRGVLNYCVIACISLKKYEVNPQKIETFYDNEVKIIKDLLQKKNHDYGEAWRHMRVSSFTDQILTRVVRIKTMEDQGVEKNTEAIISNYQDIFNYCIFALILK